MRRAVIAVAAIATIAAASGGGLAVAGGKQPRIPPRPESWRPYWTDVNPGSGVQFASPTAGFALSGQPVNSLDDLLSAPSGLTIAWPSPAVLVSHDAGRNWRTSLSAAAGFWGLAFADRLHGIAVGVTKLFRTADGGRRWLRIPEPGQPLVRVAYGADPETVLGLTTIGRLVMSRSGGSSWTSTAYKGRAQAICTLGDEVVLADPGGGVWRSKDPSYPFERVAGTVQPRIQYGPWWVDLSCGGGNAVEFMQALCEAACGGGVQTIVRQSSAGGVSWRRIVLSEWGSGPESPLPAQAVAVGTRTACLLSYPQPANA